MARLRNERFTSLGEANVEIARLVEWVNERPFKKVAGSCRSLFGGDPRHSHRAGGSRRAPPRLPARPVLTGVRAYPD